MASSDKRGHLGQRLSRTAVVLVVALSAGSCGTTGSTGAGSADGARTAVRAERVPRELPSAPGASPTTSPPTAATPGLADLAGLGPRTSARIPADARQVVVVTGQNKDSPRSQVELYRKTASGWQGDASWPAHNALKGWTADHHLDDLRSPIGVFTLSDAGGLLPDPGSKLPYTRSGGFSVTGTGFQGESLAGSFDYVIAIDYNRAKGTSPLDWTRPLGADKGGGVWLHVDHGGPTHACVSLPEEHMKELLRTLDPALHPVVVMGDAASLAK
ncbi:L,D-transpeptidase family protein [Streptomyces brasiliensis]|uniref:L,D-TPase catalytic domain-containing protein n=1 Tax=Streptomyces brasiliensis TaxID=1954 RepID=A0A917LEC7_9ACTN|nr:L,D-transpeptidase family protein [Streptomyces brasiliensis]GGJ58915.1 hypothetical protein GCM10010121_082000 [Streptomyces brasiliensis]